MTANNIEVDIAILGGGIGGYTAAVRAAQLGKSVVLVEKDKLGGTCLHRGCIPSKSLLRSAEMFRTMKDSVSYGIEATGVSINFDKILQRKDETVAQLYQGVQSLVASHKIQVIHGTGRVIGPSIFSPKSGALAIETSEGESINVVSTNLIIATGSKPRTLPGIEIDGTTVMTSDEALQMKELPQSIIIVGGGVIGVEWASLLHDFGVEVTVIEAGEQLIPQEDSALAKELQRLMSERGIKIITSAKLNTASLVKNDDVLTLTIDEDGKERTLTGEKLLVCVGRTANTAGLGIENTDITLADDFIKVNANMQTSEPHIYAIGDVNGGMQLAHVAAYEGKLAVEHCAGLPVEASPQHLVPRCIYTQPEVAAVGWTEQEALAQGYKLRKATIPFRVIGKAHVLGMTDGFVKVIADEQTNDILGVHMIGPQVTDHISEATVAQLLDATPWEVSQAIHPHPTLSEGLSEAMQAVARS